jgi:hypothetical protein
MVTCPNTFDKLMRRSGVLGIGQRPELSVLPLKPPSDLLCRNGDTPPLSQGYSDRITELTGEWKRRLGRYRQGSALDLLVRALPGAPLITPDGTTNLVGRSPVAVRAAITQLLEARVLVLRSSSSPRNRVLEAPEVTELMTSLERILATPHGNTHHENPVRPAPHPPPSSPDNGLSL